MIANLRTIERALVEADAIPLVGGIPPIPWDAIASHLGDTFKQPLTLTPQTPEWEQADQAQAAMGDFCWHQGLVFPTLDGAMVALMAQADARTLAGWILEDHTKAAMLEDAELIAGLLQCVALEGIGALREAGYPEQLLPHFHADVTVEGPTLIWDVSIRQQEDEVRLRLLLSESLCHSLRTKWAVPRPTPLSTELAQATTLTVHASVGRVDLEAAQFRDLRVGDFIALDHCTADPDTGDGTASLTVASHSLCRAKLLNRQLEVES